MRCVFLGVENKKPLYCIFSVAALVFLIAISPVAGAKSEVVRLSLDQLIHGWLGHLETGKPLYLRDALYSIGVPTGSVGSQETKIIAAINAPGLGAGPGYAEGWRMYGGSNILAISFGVKSGTHIVAGSTIQFRPDSCVAPRTVTQLSPSSTSHPAGGDGTQMWTYTNNAKHGSYSILVSQRIEDPKACAQTLTFYFE